MKRRLTGEQIIGLLNEVEAGAARLSVFWKISYDGQAGRNVMRNELCAELAAT